MLFYSNLNLLYFKVFKLLTIALCAFLLGGCELFVRRPAKLEKFIQEIPAVNSRQRIESINIKSREVGSDPLNFVNETSSAFKVQGSLSAWSKRKLALNFFAQPVIADGKIFALTSSGRVEAYSVKDGRLLWSALLGCPRPRKASMLFQNGRLYVAADNCFAVFENGEEIIYRRLQYPILSGICIHGNQCSFQTLSGLYSINLIDGAVSSSVMGLREEARISHNFKPLVYKKNLICSFFAGRLAVVDLDFSKGEISFIDFAKSSIPAPTILPIRSLVCQPLLVEKYCYFATSHGVVQKCDLNIKENVWSAHIPCVQNISLIGKTIFATTMGGQLVAINQLDGSLIWSAKLCSKPAHFLPAFAVNEYLVVISSDDGKGFCLKHSGEIAFTFVLPAADEVIAVAIHEGKLVVFCKDGTVLENMPS